jgi:sugar lactone lactonase YvrE
MCLTSLSRIALAVTAACSSNSARIVPPVGDNGDDQPLVYLSATERAGAGDLEGALAALAQLDAHGWSFCPPDRDMAGLVTVPRYRELCARMKSRAPVVARATVAMTLSDPRLAPEGIAYDDLRSAVFIGSMVERKIVRIAADGTQRDFATRANGLDAVVGVRVDAPHGLLWAASNAMPMMNGFDTKDTGRVALFAFDLETGALRERFVPPAAGSHLFNDVAIGPDGTAYVTDTDGGAVWRGRVGQPGLVAFMPPGTLRYPNGVACDGRRIFVAHLAGVAVVPLGVRTPSSWRELATRSPMTLGGFDGLYVAGDMLFGVQNGFGTSRVLRVDLDADHTAVVGVTVLEASSALETPTTAALVLRDRRLLVLVPGDNQPTVVLSISIDDGRGGSSPPPRP